MTGQAAKSLTIYDVARAAGVASSTVSRAFARPGRVNAETAERIRQVAVELGYRTNPLARALPTGRTSMISLVISDVTNPFYNEIIRGAGSAAAGPSCSPQASSVSPRCSGSRSHRPCCSSAPAGSWRCSAGRQSRNSSSASRPTASPRNSAARSPASPA